MLISRTLTRFSTPSQLSRSPLLGQLPIPLSDPPSLPLSRLMEERSDYINRSLVLLAGSIPIATPTVLSVSSIPDPSEAHADIKIVDFKPFNPINKHTECNYCEESASNLKRVAKGMTGIIVELCSHNKADGIENRLEADVEVAMHGLHALAVAFEEVEGDDHDAEGNGFQLI